MKFKIYGRRFVFVLLISACFLIPRHAGLQELQTELPQSPSQTFTVINTSDTGAGSLRQAILDANASPGLDTINFNIAGSGMRLFPLTNALPTITDPVVIDGTSLPGYAGVPLLTLTGISNGQALNITAGNSTVKGMAFYDFTGAANNIVTLATGGNNVITGCYFGINANNSRGFSTTATGIAIVGSNGNRIGGSTPAERNYFVEDSGNNIIIRNGSANNRITGNWFGTGPNGTRQTMSRESVHIENAPNNTIGGSVGTTPGGACTGECNVIAATGFQGGRGIYINGASATGNRVIGNFIGLLSDGVTVNRIDGAGVHIDNAPGNFIGGTTPAERNVIAGNTDSGVWVQGAGSTGNVITGNYIGLFTNGSAAPSIATNAIRGISLFVGSIGTRVGGLTPGERNIISGNRTGILIQSSTNNRILGNYIGTDAAGITRSTTSDHGIFLIGGSNGNTIGGKDGTTLGGPCTGACNLISGNGNDGASDGILVHSSDGNTIDGNLIGLNAVGTTPILNGVTPNGSVYNGKAIRLVNADNNTVGRRPASRPDARSASPSTLWCIADPHGFGFLTFDDSNGDFFGKFCPTGQEVSGRSRVLLDLFDPTISLVPQPPLNHPVIATLSTVTNEGDAHVVFPATANFPAIYDTFHDANISDATDCGCDPQEYAPQTVLGPIELGGENGGSSDENYVGDMILGAHVQRVPIAFPPRFPVIDVPNGNGNLLTDLEIWTPRSPALFFGFPSANNTVIDLDITILSGGMPIDIGPGAQENILPPVITLASTPGNSGIVVNGFITGLPNTKYEVSLFGVDSLVPGLETGTIYRDLSHTITVTTDANGTGSFIETFTGVKKYEIERYPELTATATRLLDQRPEADEQLIRRSTSEMSSEATVPGVNVSGRVTTSAGLGLRNARVTMTDQFTGAAMTATTSSFGTFTFTNVVRSRLMLVTVSSKRFRFAQQTISADGDLTNVDFIGLE